MTTNHRLPTTRFELEANAMRHEETRRHLGTVQGHRFRAAGAPKGYAEVRAEERAAAAYLHAKYGSKAEAEAAEKVAYRNRLGSFMLDIGAAMGTTLCVLSVILFCWALVA